MAQSTVYSTIDTIKFSKKFPNSDQFVGLYATLDVTGQFIKTLGTYSDTCGLNTPTKQNPKQISNNSSANTTVVS